MDEQFQPWLDYLQQTQADQTPHTDRALLDHLLGTYQLLVDWNVPREVFVAGLFHSVYGTEHFAPATISLSKRDEVRRLIGEEAEALAWMFCLLRRESLDENLHRAAGFAIQDRRSGERTELNDGQFRDLVTLTFANMLEALPRLSWRLRRACREYLRQFRPVAIPAAREAFDRADARWWEVWK